MWASGYDLSVVPDRWKDVQVIRKEVNRVWKRQLRTWKKVGAFADLDPVLWP